jgi:AraC-like DNA-binding protein
MSEVIGFDIWMAPRPVGHLHRHDHHELFFCDQGRGLQHTEAGDVAMAAGDLFLFPAQQLHIGSARSVDRCLGLVIYVDDDAFRGDLADREIATALGALCRACRPGRNRLPVQASAAAIRGALRRLVEEHRCKAAGYRSAVKACLQEALVALLRDPAVAPLLGGALSAPSTGERIDDVCRHVRSHFHEPLDIATAARLANLGRSHFHVAFRRRTGETFAAFVRRVRVEEAQRLLRETDQPIVAIALRCGFESLSRFYAAFAARVGTSPAAYRRSGGVAIRA